VFLQVLAGAYEAWAYYAFFGIVDNKHLVIHKPVGVHVRCKKMFQQLNVMILPVESDACDSTGRGEKGYFEHKL